MALYGVVEAVSRRSYVSFIPCLLGGGMAGRDVCHFVLLIRTWGNGRDRVLAEKFKRTDIFVRAICETVTDEFHESRVFPECIKNFMSKWIAKRARMRAFASNIGDSFEDEQDV